MEVWRLQQEQHNYIQTTTEKKPAATTTNTLAHTEIVEFLKIIRS